MALTFVFGGFYVQGTMPSQHDLVRVLVGNTIRCILM